MKAIIITIGTIMFLSGVAHAGGKYDLLGGSSFSSGKRPYTDAYGNHYKRQGNMHKDSDHDGVINYYEKNDRKSIPTYKNDYTPHNIPRYRTPNLDGSTGRKRLY